MAVGMADNQACESSLATPNLTVSTSFPVVSSEVDLTLSGGYDANGKVMAISSTC